MYILAWSLISFLDTIQFDCNLYSIFGFNYFSAYFIIFSKKKKKQWKGNSKVQVTVVWTFFFIQAWQGKNAN